MKVKIILLAIFILMSVVACDNGCMPNNEASVEAVC